MDDDDGLLASFQLRVDPYANVLICVHEGCRFALTNNLSHIDKHLRVKHQRPADVRHRIIGHLRARDRALQDPADAPLRLDGSPSDADLLVHEGFSCKFCHHRTINKQIFSRHVSETHERTRSDLRVGIKAMYDPVHLQAWTKSPAQGRYWIVERGGRTIRLVGSEAAVAHLQGVFEREASRTQAQAEQGGGVETRSKAVAFTDRRPWLERTDWEVTYQNVHKPLLQSLVALPNFAPRPGGRVLAKGGSGAGHARLDFDLISAAADELKIAALAAAVDQVIDRCEQTARTAGRSMLCWLYSVRPNTCYVKPFRFVAHASSRAKYVALLKRFIAMVFRAYRLPTDVCRRAAGIRFKKAQLEAMAAIWEHAVWEQEDAMARSFWQAGSDSSQDSMDDNDDDVDDDDNTDLDRDDEDEEEEEEEEEGEEGEEGEDGDDDEDDDDDEGEGDDDEDDDDDEGEGDDGDATEQDTIVIDQPADQAQVVELVERLFGLLMLFCTETITDGRPASMLLVYYSGILGFTHDCRSFLPARSYTTHLAALIYVQRLLFLEYAIPARAYPLLGIRRRPRTNRLERLQAVRQKYMVLGSQSTFDEFFDLRTFGRAVASSDTPAFLLRWSGDGQSVSYGDAPPVSMGAFRRLPAVLLQEAGRLCFELMYEWEPPVDLRGIQDDLTNKNHGFSFVSHPKNGLHDAYIELSIRACTSQSNSLFRNGGWRHKAVHEYRKKDDKLRELLAALLYMTGGGQPRGPDLLSLRHRNCGTAERGIYLYGGSMIYLTRNHKVKRSTNREFLVARFLPVQVGHLLYKYLVYIRPFVDLLVREQTSCKAECSSYLFRSRPDLDSPPWATSRLTSVMKRWTEKAWSQSVSLQMLRQVCIGVAEKHVREVSRPFNRYDDHSDAANVNVVLAWQTGHRPLQRARTYGLDGAFPTQLQPQLLELYEQTSSRWHEFLHLPSKIAPERLAKTQAQLRRESTHLSYFIRPSPPRHGNVPFFSQSEVVNLDDDDDDDDDDDTVIPVLPRRPTLPSHPMARSSLITGRGLNDAQPGSLKRSAEASEVNTLTVSPTESVSRSVKRRQVESSASALAYKTKDVSASAEPLFGWIGEVTSLNAAEACQTTTAYLAGQAADLRIVKDGAYEIVFPHKTGSHSARSDSSTIHPSYALDRRLERIHETVEEWRFVGCALCYATTGEREPDHDIHSCTLPSSNKARRILCWLESLSIPRFFQHRGCCSYCVHGWGICDEIRAGHRIESAKDPKHKARLIQEYESKPSQDGYCTNRPLIRKIVAALCAYDDQLLGKVLSKIALDSDGVDLTLEKQARQWFEQRIRSSKGFWVPRLVYVLDQLILAFRFRHTARYDQEQQVDEIDYMAANRWDNALEVEDWKTVLSWLVGRCTFCAGRGLRDEHIRHTLRQCKRGGASTATSGLAEAFYEDGFVPSNGCDQCLLPREFCSRWERGMDGKYVSSRWSECRYDESLLCDSIVGFVKSGVQQYENDIWDEMEVDCDEDTMLKHYDDEMVAAWLSQHLTVAGIHGSRMLRQLTMWTMGLATYRSSPYGGR